MSNSLVVRLNAKIHMQREELRHKEFVIQQLKQQLIPEEGSKMSNTKESDSAALTDVMITPAMIEAGTSALADNCDSSSVGQATAVFRAMKAAALDASSPNLKGASER